MQVVKGSSRTTGSGHNREVVALYRWPLVQVPPYRLFNQQIHMYILSDKGITTSLISATKYLSTNKYIHVHNIQNVSVFAGLRQVFKAFYFVTTKNGLTTEANLPPLAQLVQQC